MPHIIVGSCHINMGVAYQMPVVVETYKIRVKTSIGAEGGT